MPNKINFPMPPTLRGDEAAKLGQMHTWMFQLAEQLNVALNSIDSGNMTEIARQALEGTSAKQALSEDLNSQREQLKALIIKTADIVRNEFDAQYKQFQSDYVAQSEFGVYQENVTRQIEDTAHGTVENYAADINLESYLKDSVDFSQWKAETNGFIRKGYIYEEDGVPVLGIAIGQDIITGYIKDGIEQFDVSNSNLGFFTSKGLEFYVNGLKVATFTNEAMLITDAKISGKLTIGNWEISQHKGLTFKWIGG